MRTRNIEMAPLPQVVFHIPQDQLARFDWITESRPAPLQPVDWVIDMPPEPPLPLAAPASRWGFCGSIMTPIASCVKKLFSTTALTAASVASSIPATIYAFVFPSGEQPNAIGAAWWNAMSLGKKTFSVANGVASFAVNMLSNKKYMPLAVERLKLNLSHFCRSPLSCFSNSSLLTLGFIAALVAAAISFLSLAWTIAALEIGAAIANFATTGARRYVGLTSLVDFVRNLFDKDMRFQRYMLDYLKHLNPEYQHEIHRMMNNQPINKDNARLFLEIIFNRAIEIRNDSHFERSLFLKKTNWDIGKEYLQSGIIVAAALLLSLIVIPANVTNGFVGLNFFSNLFFNYSLDSFSNLSKIFLGLSPGVVTAAFFLISLLKSDVAIEDIYESYKAEPKKTAAKFVLLAGAMGISSTAYEAISAGTIQDDNIFGFDPQSTFSDFLNKGNAVSSTAVGMENIHNFILSDKVEKTGLNPLIKFLKREKICREDISALRRHAFFLPHEEKLQTQIVAPENPRAVKFHV